MLIESDKELSNRFYSNLFLHIFETKRLDKKDRPKLWAVFLCVGQM